MWAAAQGSRVQALGARRLGLSMTRSACSSSDSLQSSFSVDGFRVGDRTMCSRPGQSEAWPEQPVACARGATSRRDLGRLPPVDARSIGHAHASKMSSLQISSQIIDHHQFEHRVRSRARQPPGRAFVARASSGLPHERDELAAVSLNKACTNTGEGEWGWMDEGCMHAYDGKVQRAGIGSGLGRLHGLGDGGWKVTNEAMSGVGMRKNRKARLGKIGWNFGKPGVIRVTDPVGELRGFAGQRAGSGAHDGLGGLASEDQGGLPLCFARLGVFGSRFGSEVYEQKGREPQKKGGQGIC